MSEILIEKEVFYKISNVNRMRPFFMSILSPSNHWMFVGSNGGISAGRQNPENALFPYYTDDKIIESSEYTGSKTIIKIGNLVWEPFSIHYADRYQLSRSIYKNVYGNKVIFEEINHDLQLIFQYEWTTSDVFGFVKTSKLTNLSDKPVDLKILDGIQNIIPSGVGSALQNDRSNLVDAYKRNELHKESGIGIYALSAIIVDKAEPSEALKANMTWSIGLKNTKHLLSSLQLSAFRDTGEISDEFDVKAEKGAYFISTDLRLLAKGFKEWIILSDINKSATQIIALAENIKNSHEQDLIEEIKVDILKDTRKLISLNATSDGLQLTADSLRDTRHFSNVMFNIMRGGVFDHNYQIERFDFENYISRANSHIFDKYKSKISKLPTLFKVFELRSLSIEIDNLDFNRLSMEYLPLKFSRRHGDPSRPWNQFSINTQNEDGTKVLDYAGNWRDIFQNWEALAYSYPEFIDGMIFRFLNASTFDGYNPYRITKHGIDWEKIEADDPWSYIGYWGDHQIIYLLKFLEFVEKFDPKRLESYFSNESFVYANVPYKIKAYEDILQNPKDTIDFDHQLDQYIQNKCSVNGSDAALIEDQNGFIHHVSFIEKILATLLSKISNFIPEGGIWMNTQRPEWNDANNALVGNGVSMVTLYYMRRFLSFFNTLIINSDISEFLVSDELLNFFQNLNACLEHNKNKLEASISNLDRKIIMDGLGRAGSNYRVLIYKKSFQGKKVALQKDDLIAFNHLFLGYIDHTIRANKRTDQLYHAYNLMTIDNDSEVSISYLSEMLEGQVAVLSSGFLTSQEALNTLDALKSSQLFREDQYSYLLYPNKKLPGFLQKNNISADQINTSAFLKHLNELENKEIIEKDIHGCFHFNGSFKNAQDLQRALNKIMENGIHVSEEDRGQVLSIFEKTFNHKAFTGRSGTFYGYEGLGSIYWHMVSKLLLAVQECCILAIEKKQSNILIGKLLEHYYEINEGIGVHKSPTLYGAFPTDPYSHTPGNKGAQQPGMTGQVKEDIICRFGELGLIIDKGKIGFLPNMLRKNEFLMEEQKFKYFDLQGNESEILIPKDSIAFTYCQTPVIYQLADKDVIKVDFKDNKSTLIDGLFLDLDTSREIFHRSGSISKIWISLNSSRLK
nr:hypothetical protein [Belliella kenyensis]